mmetsp:Transcript_48235/g.104948  ORF Transcript_48235/g.104948 Transcript_48235/m.104948 type:complete len:666 (+) Transcript_48235:87-2084(+)|eukprot:CAMPEP_0204253246 /NCGR_PEP_ID=MMETSP0468-20130131/1763_1 /ASSEMBLY_ACC=CAM_ASM_000383 /TAXON_ID=2969 /ORGANISM="Oxyrrhis marina" /LENGTH=665 /DNA_ID=CAMNT_0051226795 /DNA_START=74 /DNA_END=2071 /DNA_ORIENTATION=+
MRCVAISFLALCAAEEERPVTKVVNLLKDMQAQLEADEKNDKTTYEKLVCWCQNNKKAKEEAVATANSRITDLTAAIQEYAAESAKLEVEISQHKKEIAQGKNALSMARADREHGAEAWYADEKDLIQAIAALKNALKQLELPQTSLIHVAHVAQRVLTRHESTFAGRLPEAERHSLTSLLQQPASAGSYNKQSDQIHGILSSMLEEMEKDLAEGQSQEKNDASDYQELKSSRTAENDAGKQAAATKKSELAEAQVNLENSKEDLQDTRDALAADTAFLSDLNLRCQGTDKLFEQRVADRNEELAAVRDTIKILSDDDAAETMSRSMNFLQLGSRSGRVAETQARGAARAVLLQAAAKSGSAALLTLAGKVQLDAFTKIKEAIDKMVGELKQEMEDEVKHSDYCTAELNKTEKDLATNAREKSELEDRIEELTSTMENLSKEIEAAQKDIADMKVEILKAGQNREAENADFQATMKDQRETQAILHKAMTRLAVVYGKTQEERIAATGASGLVQQPNEPGVAAPPPPPGFDKAEKNKGSTGVLSMIEGLVEDSKKVEADAVKDEAQAQEDYENFVSDSNSGIAKLEKAITDKTEARAKAADDKSMAQADLEGVDGEIQRLEQYETDLHTECDFTLKNFEARQQARQEEIEALQSAKQMLNGADFS